MGTRKHLLRPIVLGACVGAAVALVSVSGAFSSWSPRAGDQFFLTRDTDPSIVIVAIDNASLAEVGRWPWSRRVHAEIIDQLREGGADMVAYDVMFAEPSAREDDDALAEAVRRAGNVVLPVELTLVESRTSLTFDPSESVTTFSGIGAYAAATGHTNTPPDRDGIFRRVPLIVAAPDGTSVSAFAERAFEVAEGRPPSSRAPLDSLRRFIVNIPGRPGKNFVTVSAADIVFERIDPSAFEGRRVFVGATAADLHDDQLVATSRGTPMSGVEIHAAIYDTLVQEAWITPVSPWLAALAVILLGAALGATLPFIRARWSIVFLLVVWIAVIVAAAILFERGLLADVAWPTVTLFLAYALIMLERRVTADRERARLRAAFSHYVSESVVRKILENPDALKLGGQKREMTVLFSDLRGFTSLSESLPPDELVEILNAYLARMTQIVFDNGGVLDKYIGDAVMAFWNAPFDQPDHAEQAIRTAIAMRDELERMNGEGVFPRGIELKMGIGINTGEMVVGNFGGEARFDYTVIGDAVNLASRIESATKEYNAQILISEATYHRVSGLVRARRVGEATVKGKSEPVVLYAVTSLNE